MNDDDRYVVDDVQRMPRKPRMNGKAKAIIGDVARARATKARKDRARRVARAELVARELARAVARLRASWDLESGDEEHDITVDVAETLEALAVQVRRIG